jgi:hypothetical protein
LLKAENQAGQPTAFNFGSWPNTGTRPPGSSVILTANVSISGETVAGNRTTIQGGSVPFYEAATAVTASISNLKFVNPGGTAASIQRSTGITIQNNEVYYPLPYVEYGFNQELGFYVGGGPNNPTISGPVVISGNYVHGLDSQYEFGLEVNGVQSPITISGNTIEAGYSNDPAAGTVDSEGIAVIGCAGAATISGNNVSVGTGVCYNGIVVRGPQTGAVTIVGNEVTIAANPYCYAGIGVTGSTGTVQVLANSIDSQSDFAAGIYLDGTASTGTVTGATVALNVIDIENSEIGAIELGGAVAKSSISLNLITGESADGIAAASDGTSTDLETSNTFLSNLFLGYTSTQATFFLDTTTSKNTVLGPYTSVINKGTGNTIIKGL